MQRRSVCFCSITIVHVAITVMSSTMCNAFTFCESFGEWNQISETVRSQDSIIMEESGNRSGHITSPNFPNNYPNNVDCIIVLEAPLGSVIRIDFQEFFQVEPSPDCKFDGLEVRDGRFGYSQLTGIYCGLKFPPKSVTKSRYAWLRFRSDGNLNYGGFKLSYEWRRSSSNGYHNNYGSSKYHGPCSSELTNKGGTVSAHDIPVLPRLLSTIYNITLDCSWILKIPPNSQVLIKIPEKGIFDRLNCLAGSLEIYYPTSVTNNLVMKLCDSTNILHSHTPKPTSPKFTKLKTNPNSDSIMELKINHSTNSQLKISVDFPPSDSKVKRTVAPDEGSGSRGMDKDDIYSVFLKVPKKWSQSFRVYVRFQKSNEYDKFNDSYHLNRMMSTECRRDSTKDYHHHIQEDKSKACRTKGILFEYTLFHTGLCDLDSEFMCDNETCIDNKLRCDHQVNCPNGRDEEDCTADYDSGGHSYQEMELRLYRWFRSKENLVISSLMLISTIMVIGGAFCTYRFLLTRTCMNPLSQLLLLPCISYAREWAIGRRLKNFRKFQKSTQGSPLEKDFYTGKSVPLEVPRQTTIAPCNHEIFMSGTVGIDPYLCQRIALSGNGSCGADDGSQVEDNQEAVRIYGLSSRTSDLNEDELGQRTLSDLQERSDYLQYFSDFSSTPPRYRECIY